MIKFTGETALDNVFHFVEFFDRLDKVANNLPTVMPLEGIPYEIIEVDETDRILSE